MVDEIEQRAALYLLRQEEPDWSVEDQAELESWLDQSERHKALFWRLEHGWSAADRIVSLGVQLDKKLPIQRAFKTFALRAGIALAASTVPILIGAAILFQQPVAPQYEQFVTAAGQRKILTFSDGTEIELNTDSRIRVAMDEKSRRVLLDRGEAYFEVTHDAARPFHVRSGDWQVTDLGTIFAIRRDGDKTTTAVLEGEVRLGHVVDGKMRDSLVLNPGDHAISENNSTIALYDDLAAVQDMLGWRRGIITFDRVSIGEAAAEFNRYNRRKLLIADADVAAIKIGGSFKSSNVEGFSRLMSDAYGLKVQETEDQIKISRN